MKKITGILAALVFAGWTGTIQAGLVGISSSTSGVYSIDSTTGAATLLTNIVGGGVSLTGASFLGGSLYGTDIFNGPLYTGTIDIGTGAYAGVSNQDGSNNWHGLATDESAGLMYTIDINDGDKLKSLTAGGVVTTIGSGAGIDGRGMAYDDLNDILYAIGGTSLYSLDTILGTSTLIGALGTANGWSRVGLAFDELSGTLYANEGAASSLYSLNVSTGAATLIGANSVTGIDGLAWITDGNTVPAPATLALFGLGLAGLGWSRRKKA